MVRPPWPVYRLLRNACHRIVTAGLAKGTRAWDREAEFGPEIAALVADLTDVCRPADGNRAARKSIDLRHASRATPEAKTIKLADLIDNVRSVTEHNPRFARLFLAELERLLAVLGEGDPRLQTFARAVLDQCRQNLA